MTAKARLLQIVYANIVRYYVHPLEEFIIPRLAAGNPGRARQVLLKSASWGANAGRVAVLDARLVVERWTNPEWSITYIGEGTSAEAIRYNLFPQPPEINQLGRVSIWQAPILARRCLEQSHLVICETNQIVNWQNPGHPIFSVPTWVSQVLDGIERPVDEILAGMNQTLRRRIRQLNGQGYHYELTHRPADFDLFFQHMYTQYIPSRHAGRGGILHDENFIRQLFLQGGLLLVWRDDQPVCGMLCKIDKDTCHALQMGVMDSNFELVKQGVNIALWWFMLDWARSQGARRFDLGASRAQTANGTFNFKRQWGSLVYTDPDVFSLWNFMAGALPESLRGRVNEQGFITMNQQNKAYQVYLSGSHENLDPDQQAHRLQKAAANGLSGLAIITENGEKQYYSTKAQEEVY